MTAPRSEIRPLALAGVLAGAMLWTAAAFAADADLTLRINPGFSRAALPSAEQLWYDRSWAHSAGCNSTVLSRAISDDTYTLGRSVGDYNAFMLMGLRATGDRAYLDRVRVVTDTMRVSLRDADDACVGGATDGYLDWRWRALNSGGSFSCTNTGGFYGSDYHQLDEAMTHGNIALVAYAFHINRDIAPIYANRADYWKNYLLNHWQAKWIKRVGGDSVKAWMDNAGMYKHEAHVVANLMRAAYYLWKITGNPFYKARADGLQARSAANCKPNSLVPAAYSWHHQVDNTTTWQAINYAEYTSAVFCDLHFDGYAPYASASEFSKFMSTWRDVVLKNSAPGFTSMAADVNGAGSIGIRASGLTAYARADATGKLMAYANVFGDDTPSANSIGTIRAITGTQVAISTRGPMTAVPDTIPPAQVRDLGRTP